MSAWVCPNCGSVYGPNCNECYRCNQPFIPKVICYNPYTVNNSSSSWVAMPVREPYILY